MAQTEETHSPAPEKFLAEEPSQDRLQALVSELLETNQELRFRITSLEREAANLERGLANACAPAALLLP